MIILSPYIQLQQTPEVHTIYSLFFQDISIDNRYATTSNRMFQLG
jgi:hypothetical protein